MFTIVVAQGALVDQVLAAQQESDDKEEFMNDLLEKYGKVGAFAVEIGYVCKESLDFILSKAGIEGGAIEALVGEDSGSEEKKEETKEEKPAVKAKATKKEK